MDRLTGLAVFQQVVDCKGFSAAARRLNMSVTMVSNHVQALEDRLGVRLLNRTTRKVVPTEIGRIYYERTGRVLMELDECDRFAGALQATPTGTLRLHASAGLVRFLSPVLDDYLRSHAAVAVDLTVGEYPVDILEGGIDVVIRTRTPPDSGLIVRKLASWRYILCCSPLYFGSHPPVRQPSDLLDHNCLQFTLSPYGDEWRFNGPDGKPASVRVKGNFVTTSAEALRLLAVSGLGIVLAPAFLVADDMASGSLVPLMDGYGPSEFAINAVYPSRHHVSAKVRTFVDLLARAFARQRGWMGTADGGTSLPPV